MVVLERYTEANGMGIFNESVTVPVISVCPFREKEHNRNKQNDKKVSRIIIGII
jgi:hypothetical protein